MKPLLIYLVLSLAAFSAKAAEPEFVACRLVGCTVVEKDRICVYRGTNHTQDVLYYRLDEWFPRQFQCKYAPNEKPPPTVQEVLKAIKDKMS